MDKIQLVDNLIEKLEDYNSELMECEENGEERNSWYDCYILDDVLKLKKVLYEDGVEEGRQLESFTLRTDIPVKVYDVVELERFMSGEKIKVQIMSIEEVRIKDGFILVELLGGLLRR